jgi:flagellar motor protein MotB
MRKKEPEVNYFASMTDMVVGILFIFIIMIAYFAFQVSSAKEDNPLTKYKNKVEKFKKEIAQQVVDELKQHNIEAQVSPKNPGVVTLKGSGLFLSGDSSIEAQPGTKEKIDFLSDVITKKIQCIVYKGAAPNCINKDKIFLDAIFIEGHTDNIVPSRTLNDGSKNNLELSAKRATNTYSEMVQKNPIFSLFKNLDDEQILNVSGYGEHRPAESNATSAGQEANRRIDIRFVMWIPETENDLLKYTQPDKN